MKFSLFITFVLFTSLTFGQSPTDQNRKFQKGRFFFFWGWNRDQFSKSDIHFKGNDYDFTLADVVAKDRPIPFGFNPHLDPRRITLPQYNFRIGYFFKNHYALSIGIDHMKYVVQQNQVVKITGSINKFESAYNGTYINDTVTLRTGFLKFEHTNGLNYFNIDGRRYDEIIVAGKLRLNLLEGLGIGILIPKTDATLLGMQRHDAFHLSGYGFNALLGIQLPVYRSLFIQTELKGGYINMPDILTTNSASDKANQSFFFSQINLVFGTSLDFKKNKTISSK